MCIQRSFLGSASTLRFKAFDKVRIVSGGYEVEGLHNGDIAEVTEADNNGGYFVRPLGSYGFHKHFDALFFRASELEPAQRPHYTPQPSLFQRAVAFIQSWGRRLAGLPA